MDKVTYRSFFLFIFISFAITSWSCDSCENRYVQAPNVLHDYPGETKSVFLAGSAAYRWRDRFKQMMADDELILLDPINYEKREPNREYSLMWEVDHIEKADILLTWIPSGEKSLPHTLSMTTLFELGRFAEMKDKSLIVGISTGHHMYSELVYQISQLRPDAVLVHSLEDLAEELRKFNTLRK